MMGAWYDLWTRRPLADQGWPTALCRRNLDCSTSGTGLRPFQTARSPSSQAVSCTAGGLTDLLCERPPAPPEECFSWRISGVREIGSALPGPLPAPRRAWCASGPLVCKMTLVCAVNPSVLQVAGLPERYPPPSPGCPKWPAKCIETVAGKEEADVERSLEELEEIVRSRVCPVCTDGTVSGECGLNDPDDCSLFRLFPRVAQAIQSTKSERIEDYIEAIRRDVCAVCRNEESDGSCEPRREVRCALDGYMLMVVDAIEEATGSKFAPLAQIKNVERRL